MYLDRQSLQDPGHVRKAKASLKRHSSPSAGQGLHPGGTAVGLPGQLGHDSRGRLEMGGRNMVKTFPLGVVRDKS